MDIIIDVIPTKGLYYSEPYWEKNLYFITEKSILIPAYAILDSEQWQDNQGPQAFYIFLKGMIDILSVYKYGIDNRETLVLAKNLLKKGHINCIFNTSGYLTGKWSFYFSNLGYSWI